MRRIGTQQKRNATGATMSFCIEWDFDDTDPDVPVMITGGWKMYADDELITGWTAEDGDHETVGKHCVPGFRIMVRQLLVACQNQQGRHSDEFGPAGTVVHAESVRELEVRIKFSKRLDCESMQFQDAARDGACINWQDVVDELYDAYDSLCEFAQAKGLDTDRSEFLSIYFLIEELAACVETADVD